MEDVTFLMYRIGITVSLDAACCIQAGNYSTVKLKIVTPKGYFERIRNKHRGINHSISTHAKLGIALLFCIAYFTYQSIRFRMSFQMTSPFLAVYLMHESPESTSLSTYVSPKWSRSQFKRTFGVKSRVASSSGMPSRLDRISLLKTRP